MQTVPSERPKPRHRYFRFSLKTYLIVVTIAALAIGLKLNRVRKQVQTAASVTACGGRLLYDYPLASRPTSSMGTPEYDRKRSLPGPKWLREIVGMHFFVSPVELRMDRDRKLTAEASAKLHNLRDLKRLLIYANGMDEGAMATIKTLPRLERLDLEPSTKPNENAVLQDFGFLQRLPALRELSLVQSALGDGDLRFLRRHRRLQKLRLGYTKIGDEDLRDIPKLGLLWLDVAGTRVTDAGLTELAACQQLEHLCLDDTGVSNEGVASLGHLPELKSLSLVSTTVSDGVAPYLVKFPKLVNLSLISTDVSPQGFERLHASLPNCRIQVGWGETIRPARR